MRVRSARVRECRAQDMVQCGDVSLSDVTCPCFSVRGAAGVHSSGRRPLPPNPKGVSPAVASPHSLSTPLCGLRSQGPELFGSILRAFLGSRRLGVSIPARALPRQADQAFCREPDQVFSLLDCDP